MNYTETLNYIHKVSWTGSRPGLERITELLGLLGDPQDTLRFVHVAGTNGKGSFCSMLDSVLRAEGYKTGLYTSPYIERFNERMAFDGEPITDEELSEITSYVRTFADTMKDAPTEFELITAVAMEFFKRKKCDVVVLEVGMGGRLDATNIIKDSLLSVITGISLDHTAFLGNTVEEIAAEKAGIIKKNGAVLYGGNDESAEKVIKAVAVNNDAEFYRTQRESIEIINADLSGSVFNYCEKERRISLLGLYQPYNAANVIEAVKILNSRGLSISDKSLEAGLLRARWSGRFELLREKDPMFIIDGSHNPEGIEAAIKCIKHYFGDEKVLILSGVMKDKDYPEMARNLSKVGAYAVTLRPDNPRSLEPSLYAEEFRKCSVESYASESIHDAVAHAVRLSRERNLPIVALGSLYMYGDVKRAFLAHLTYKK